MEQLIHHFKLVTEGMHVPRSARSTPQSTAPKGEFGVYLNLRRRQQALRLKLRAPGFPHLAGRRDGARHMIADAVAIIGSRTSVFGEIDRMKERHHLMTLQLETSQRGQVRLALRAHRPLVGARDLGYSYDIVPPGSRARRFDSHRAQEEMFLIVSGTGRCAIRLANTQDPRGATSFAAR